MRLLDESRRKHAEPDLREGAHEREGDRAWRKRLRHRSADTEPATGVRAEQRVRENRAPQLICCSQFRAIPRELTAGKPAGGGRGCAGPS